MKRLILIKLIVIVNFILFSASSVDAKSITDFSNTSLNYYSEFNEFVGAKATGMGGAFVAIADDLSALYYNPAGLGQVKRSEIYLCSSSYSAIKRFRRLVIGIGIGPLVSYQYDGTYRDRTSITNFSSLIGVQLFSNLYLGQAINFLSKKRYINYSLTPSEENDYHSEDEIREWAFTLTRSFGILYKPFSYLGFGATFKDRTKIDWTTSGPDWDGLYTEAWPDYWVKEVAPAIEGIDVLPPFFGFGISFRPSANLLTAADVIYKKWSSARRIESNQKIELNLKDATEFHLGLEYLTPVNIALRFGFSTVPDCVLNEVDEKQTFMTAGVGYSLGLKTSALTFDFAVADSHLFSPKNKRETKLVYALTGKF